MLRELGRKDVAVGNNEGRNFLAETRGVDGKEKQRIGVRQKKEARSEGGFKVSASWFLSLLTCIYFAFQNTPTKQLCKELHILVNSFLSLTQTGSVYSVSNIL